MNRKIKIPPQGIIKEAAERLFSAETGLVVDPESWRYKALADAGMAEAKFSLTNGKEIIFHNVLVLAQYGKASPHKLEIKASINGFSPMQRAFFVSGD